MTDVWKKKQKAHEEDYFEKKEKELLKTLKGSIEQKPPTPAESSSDKTHLKQESDDAKKDQP